MQRSLKLRASLFGRIRQCVIFEAARCVRARGKRDERFEAESQESYYCQEEVQVKSILECHKFMFHGDAVVKFGERVGSGWLQHVIFLTCSLRH